MGESASWNPFAAGNSLVEIIAWAEENAKKVGPNCMLFLQPEWSKHEEMTEKIVEYVKQNPQWNISIQAHKFMKIP